LEQTDARHTGQTKKGSLEAALHIH
jgi:hypothetical protein